MQPSIIDRPLEKHTPDPVLSEFSFPLQRTYYPLGYALELATNSTDVIEAASENWGMFAKVFDAPLMRFCLGVAPGNTKRLPPRSKFLSREHLMSIVADQDNSVVCDFSKNFAYGWVTEATAANHPVLRYHFLTATVLPLVEQMALAPIHGALIARNGWGVALIGESFSGKSTLAYAGARAGWTLISDDGIFLVRNHSDRYAIGDPHTIHFREDARRLFPELARQLPITRPNGKMGLELFTRELPIATAPGSSIDHMVFLNRNEPGPARLRHYPKAEALSWCERAVCYGTSEARAAQRRCYQRLAGAGIWELCYDDLDQAIVRLEQLISSKG
jgi:hypothetical protein